MQRGSCSETMGLGSAAHDLDFQPNCRKILGPIEIDPATRSSKVYMVLANESHINTLNMEAIQRSFKPRQSVKPLL